jgi:hypothetical protein
MINTYDLSNKNPSGTIAGVDMDVFTTLSRDDKAFLTMLERLGCTLDAIYERVEKGARKMNDNLQLKGWCLRCHRVINIQKMGPQYGPVCAKRVEAEERFRAKQDHTLEIRADTYS